MDFTTPLDAPTLIVEVSSSAFAFRNKIKSTQVKKLWEVLCEFVVTQLKQQKGVLLPNLGNFRVGPVVGEASKKIRPAFQLLEGRYGGVSQERGRYIIGGRSPIVQPNYGLLSTQSAIHRGSTQRLVSELLQRLGVHILSNRPVKCEFPGLGWLVTNKAGRIEFIFESLIMEWFEREHYALIREMDYAPEDHQVLKALQHVNLSDPPYIKSPMGVRPASGSRPISAATGVTGRSKLSAAAHAPYKGELLELFKLCKMSDRVGSGTIPRLVLEGFLHREVRGLLSQVDAATVLDLLALHTYGKTNKMILYKPFVDALDRAITPPSPRGPVRELQYESEGGAGGEAGAGDGEEVGEEATFFPQQQPGSPISASGIPAPAGPSCGPPPTAPEPQNYLHYSQKNLSPRSRADYDEFNRQHFDRLYQARGPAPKRAVTPKVGEEPLNLQEYQAVRQASPSRGSTPGWWPSPSPSYEVPSSQLQPPYQQQQPPYHPYQQQQPPYHPYQQQQVSGLPPRSGAPPARYSVAPPVPAPVPESLLSPRSNAGRRGGYQPRCQVLEVMHDPLPDQRPVPVMQPRPPGISQYDIINAEGSEKGRLKQELAQNLQQQWNRQIQERQEFEKAVSQAEGQWPFGMTGMPNDKRPVSAISRPPVSPRRTRPSSPFR